MFWNNFISEAELLIFFRHISSKIALSYSAFRSDSTAFVPLFLIPLL